MGNRIAALVQAGKILQAYDMLSPVLAERTPFDTLERIGEIVGTGPLDETGPEGSRKLNAFLDHIAADKSEGGWVVRRENS